MDRRICICFFLLLLPLLTLAEPRPKKLWPFGRNRFDKEGQYHGRWKIYTADNATLLRNGRYRHGRETGVWRYYHPNGQLRKIEYHKRKSPFFLTKVYHDNRQVERQGMARVVETERDIHYFWTGTWQVYDRQGQFSHAEYYEKGREIRLELATK
ncbi:toxin-antitoxin system YwqK family antitoxin [Pontibacter roseus]|uniref:toxin-antitoxin system YwqK family antitoxin n=1 Tax=Pontibacter roseus TaxID=336989 RepID=UPI0012F73F58|nr:hypothetical protein [Pontibacter roseus]